MKISSEKQEGMEIVEEGFLDCGATGKFIDQNYARSKRIKTKPLETPIKVYNVDGTPNKRGTIKYYADLNVEIHGRNRKERFLVTGLGRQKIILGFPWLAKANPIIDWQKATLEWRQPEPGNALPKQEERRKTPATISEEEDEEEYLNSTQNPNFSLYPPLAGLRRAYHIGQHDASIKIKTPTKGRVVI